MENKKPFNLEKVLIAYNFCQVLANLYIVVSVNRRKKILITWNYFNNFLDIYDGGV